MEIDRGLALERGSRLVDAFIAACPGFVDIDGWGDCNLCRGNGVVMLFPHSFDAPVMKLFGWESVRFPKNRSGVRTRTLTKPVPGFRPDTVRIGPCSCVSDKTDWDGEFVDLEVVRGSL